MSIPTLYSSTELKKHTEINYTLYISADFYRPSAEHIDIYSEKYFYREFYRVFYKNSRVFYKDFNEIAISILKKLFKDSIEIYVKILNRFI